MSNHVCTPPTSRALVAAGFDMPTTLSWFIQRTNGTAHLAMTGSPAYRSDLYDALPAPMATEIQQWIAGRLDPDSEGRNPAEAVAALVLDGRDD